MSIDTYSEAWRHQCEVREVAGWRTESGRPNYPRMMNYFVDVSQFRGVECAEKLRLDVRALLESQGFQRATERCDTHEHVRAVVQQRVTEPDLFAEVLECE